MNDNPYQEFNRESMKILFVDDEKISCEYFKRICGQTFEVIVVKNAEEALQSLENHSENIAIIVSDQRMPGMSGTELLNLVRSRYPNIVRILSTAYISLEADNNDQSKSLVLECIPKPWDVDSLIESLHRAIGVYIDNIHQQR